MHEANKPKFTPASRLKSIGYAIDGIAFMLRTQHNAWLHGVATLAVIALALVCQVSAHDWRSLVAAITMVWVGEAVNTAIEYLCDVVSPEHNLAVKHAKDIAAGAVLLTALGAAVIGGLVFWPYLS